MGHRDGTVRRRAWGLEASVLRFAGTRKVLNVLGSGRRNQGEPVEAEAQAALPVTTAFQNITGSLNPKP